MNTNKALTIMLFWKDKIKVCFSWMLFELEVNRCQKQIKNVLLLLYQRMNRTEAIFIVTGFWQKNSKLIRISKVIGFKYIVVLYKFYRFSVFSLGISPIKHCNHVTEGWCSSCSWLPYWRNGQPQVSWHFKILMTLQHNFTVNHIHKLALVSRTEDPGLGIF